MDNTKPGVKTTEFWVTIITQITGMLAVFGVISPEQSQTLMDAAPIGAEIVNDSMNLITGIITRVTGLIVMVGSAFGYAQSRAKTKAKGVVE